MSEYLNTPELQSYVLGPGADAYRPGGEAPKRMGGIYMLFDDDGRLLYVGKSLSIGYRVTQHYWSSRRGQKFPFAEYTALDVPAHLIDYVECAHIHALDPPGNNKNPRPDWEFHEAMVGLVKRAWENTHERIE